MNNFISGAKQLKWEMNRDSWIKGRNKKITNKGRRSKGKPSFKSGHKNTKKKK
jgi:hypothetical protein